MVCLMLPLDSADIVPMAEEQQHGQDQRDDHHQHQVPHRTASQ
jgi:hypothetical protein